MASTFATSKTYSVARKPYDRAKLAEAKARAEQYRCQRDNSKASAERDELYIETQPACTACWTIPAYDGTCLCD